MTASNSWFLTMWHGGLLLGVGVGREDWFLMIGGVLVSLIAFYAFRKFVGFHSPR